MDPGLAGERTALAWVRSALSWAVGGGLAVRFGLAEGSGPLAYVLAAVLVATGVAMAGYGRRAPRAPEEDEPDFVPYIGAAEPRWCAAIAAVTVGCGVLAAVVVLLA